MSTVKETVAALNEEMKNFTEQFSRELNDEKVSEADLLDRVNLELSIFRAQRPNCPAAMLRNFDFFLREVQCNLEDGRVFNYKGKVLKNEFREYIEFWQSLGCK